MIRGSCFNAELGKQIDSLSGVMSRSQTKFLISFAARLSQQHQRGSSSIPHAFTLETLAVIESLKDITHIIVRTENVNVVIDVIVSFLGIASSTLNGVISLPEEIGCDNQSLLSSDSK
jgi:hypothetical protein